MVQLYSKDITPDDKQELDEALQREVLTAILMLIFMLFLRHIVNMAMQSQ